VIYAETQPAYKGLVKAREAKMLTRKIRLLRADSATLPAGIILYTRRDEPGKFIVHYFERERGSAVPKPDSYWQGSYCSTLERAEAEFNRRVARALTFDLGGSLIPQDREVGELMVEKVRV
jgi:hypothetical protein